MPIAWREMYAFIVACATWCHHFVGHKVSFNCDNEVVVSCLEIGDSKSNDIMVLHRKLFFICECNNSECSAVSTASKQNVLADASLRRGLLRFVFKKKLQL